MLNALILAWRRIPVVVRATATGIAVGGAGTLVWAKLISANLRHASSLPWAVPIMASFLFLYWRYFVRGDGWPTRTRAARRESARANPVSEEVWPLVVGAGLVGLVSILMLQGVMSRLVRLPAQRDIDPSQYPLATVFLWVAMSAVVAGVVEETAFRGYLQRPIERRHGLPAAIIVTGIVFGFAHFSHPEVGLVLLPYYLAVGAVYGSMAYVTDSTLPSMALHIAGNMLSAFDLFARGRSEWQPTAAAPKTIWETGVDAGFVVSVALFGGTAAISIAAFTALARRTARARETGRVT